MLDTRGGPRRARVYRPLASGPLPTLVYVHGGGYILGGIEETEAETRRFAASIPANVVSLSYRLAPEHPWPAAVDDVEDQVSAIAAGAISGLSLPLALARRQRGRGAGGGCDAALHARPGLAHRALRPAQPLAGHDHDQPVGLSLRQGPPARARYACRHGEDVSAGRRVGRPSRALARATRRAAGFPSHAHPGRRVRPALRRRGPVRPPPVGSRHSLRNPLRLGMLHGFHGWFVPLPPIEADLEWLDSGIRAWAGSQG